MFALNMLTKCTRICCLVITLLTRIFDSVMYGLNMLLKATLCCCLVSTLLTRIFNTFMLRLYMLLQIIWWRCLLIILLTRKLFTFMYRMHMNFYMVFCFVLWSQYWHLYFFSPCICTYPELLLLSWIVNPLPALKSLIWLSYHIWFYFNYLFIALSMICIFTFLIFINDIFTYLFDVKILCHI